MGKSKTWLLVIGFSAWLAACGGGGDAAPAAAPAATEQSWATRFGTTANSVNHDVATDASKNVYIVGGFTGASLPMGVTTLTKLGSTDAYVAKLDASGNVVWAKNFGGAGITMNGRSVGLDGSGNVFVAGNFSGGNVTSPAMTMQGTSDYYVIKLDASGNVLWSRNFGPGSAWDLNRGMYVNSAGEVFFVGSMTTNWTSPALTKIGSTDAFIVKLDGIGNVVWAQNFGGAGGNARSWEVTGDSAGNIYTSGYFNNANMTTPALALAGGSLDGYLIMLDSSGTPIWARAYGGSGVSMTPGGLSVDASDEVYVGFHFSGSNPTTPALTKIGTQDALLMRVDNSGTTVWSRNYGGTGATFSVNGVVAAGGKVHLFGALSGANLSTPAVTRLGTVDAVNVQVDASGTTLSSQNFGGSGASVDTASTGTVKAANSLVLVGGFSGANLSTPALTKVATKDAFVLQQAQ